MEIFKMNPVFKDNIWGGTRLKEEYGKATPYEITGESWEVASHKNGESTVIGGSSNGKTIAQLTEEFGAKLLGDKVYGKDYNKFPLLVKFIDARESLSVQVHPDDAYAFENENGELGKTEMWYVMDALPGAGILYGFKESISKEEFKTAIENNTLTEYTQFVPCKKGDSFFIPAGTLHAIGEGLLIAEIQQNSDTTYRIYDYGRIDANGNGRELHIQKAMDVTLLSPATENEKGEYIADCSYFKVKKIDLSGDVSWETDKNRFEIIVVCEGSVSINGVEYDKGETALVPAYAGKVTVCGNGVVLKSFPTV